MRTDIPLLGRSLLGRRYNSDRDYLAASSYGAIYGLLSGSGDRLFVGDALNLRSTFYRTGPSPAGQLLQMNSSMEEDFQTKMRERIRSLHEFYGIPTAP
jgi:hypothetical protein